MEVVRPVWENDFRVYNGEAVRLVDEVEGGFIDDQGNTWTCDNDGVCTLGNRAFKTRIIRNLKNDD